MCDGVGVDVHHGDGYFPLYGDGATVPHDRTVILIPLYEIPVLPDRTSMVDLFVHQACIPAVMGETARQLYHRPGAYLKVGGPFGQHGSHEVPHRTMGNIGVARDWQECVMFAGGRLGHVGTVGEIFVHAHQGDGVPLGGENHLQGGCHGQSLLATGEVHDCHAIENALFSLHLEQCERPVLSKL